MAAKLVLGTSACGFESRFWYYNSLLNVMLIRLLIVIRCIAIGYVFLASLVAGVLGTVAAMSVHDVVPTQGFSAFIVSIMLMVVIALALSPLKPKKSNKKST